MSAAASGAGAVNGQGVEQTLVLVRHGSTEWSSAGRHTGRTDVPLDPVGERQAGALAGLLGPLLAAGPAGTGRPPVLVSPLVRAVRTAELAGLVPYRVDDDLAEWDYGAYEGLTTSQIREQVPGWTVFSQPCPGGESAADVAARCDRVLGRVAAVDAPLTVLVAHSHLLRSLAARWLGRPVADGAVLPLETASVSVLGHEHGGRTLRRWNIANPAEEPLP